MNKKFSLYGIFVWFLAILFFFYEFFLRIVLGTIATSIMEDLHITIDQFSYIGAAYYLTYGLMQVPVGIITEKLGTRLVLPIATLLCALGIFWLSISHSFYPAFFSRLLLGFGSSFGFVCVIILALNWFPKKYFALLCGIAVFLGSVGPLLAGAPLAYLYESLDGNWRLIMVGCGIFGLLLAALLALFMRNKPVDKTQQVIFLTAQESIGKKLKALIRNRQAWLVLLAAALLYSPIPLLSAYYGTTYLESRGFDKTPAAFIISMIWVGYAVSSPLIGRASDMVKRRLPLFYFPTLLGCFVSIALLFAPTESETVLVALILLIGFACATQALAFALIVEHTPKKLHSAAIGLTNGVMMLSGAVVPPLVGLLIRTAHDDTGKITITTTSFQHGLSVIPIMFALASLIAYFWIKETYCREQHEIHKISTSIHKASDLLNS